MVAKAADFLTITSRKETDLNLKRLRERLNEVEKEKSEIKQEYQNEKRALEQKLYDYEIEKNNSRRNEKLLEERMKYLSEDKEK